MKPPAPRTLSATPTPQLRTPRTAVGDARFPSLAVVLAGGALVPACAAPVCGETRADELEAHGRSGVRAAGRGEASAALREVGVALGVVAHTSTTVPQMHTAGAPPPVVVTPPVVQPPVVADPPVDNLGNHSRMRPSGGAMRVAPVAPVARPRPRPVTPPTPQLRDPTRPMVPSHITAGAPTETSVLPQTVAPRSPVPPQAGPREGARRGDIAAIGPRPPRVPTT